jgi:uncharacterized protein YidB (DUF937 family)
MGVLDIILGRDAKGNSSKVNMALIALLLWRWYQSAGRQGAPQPAPSPRGQARMPGAEPARVPGNTPAQIPSPGTGSAGDSDFGPLIESTRRMPDMPSRGEQRGPTGGGLGDILGDILGGGRAPSGGSPRGGGLNDILGYILGGGRAPSGGNPRSGGGLGDLLGTILGGGKPMPGSRLSGSQGDPFSELLRGAGGGNLGSLLAGGAAGGALGDILTQFDQAGRGEAARSWMASGQNVPVSPADIEQTFGPEIFDQLSDQFGLDRNELLQGLSQTLPDVVDQLTPDGRLPTEDEVMRRL